MILEHFQAVKSLVPASVKVYLFQPKLSGPPAMGDYPYAVLWGSLGEEVSGEQGDRTLADDVDQLAMRIRCTYVGLNGESLAIVARNVRAALNRSRPTVDGWSCSKLRQSPLTDGQTDYDVKIGNLNPVFAVDEFTFTSSRLTAPIG